MLAAGGAPHQGAVAGIEFLDAPVGLDHLRAGDADAPLLGDDEGRAAGGDESAAAVAARTPADEADDARSGAARVDQGAHDLGDGGLAGIGLLQPDAAGIEQDQHRRRLIMISCNGFRRTNFESLRDLVNNHG